MSCWDREALWNKARLYFERAFKADINSDEFGIWCSMGLELLARSTIAYINPVLLAEPDKEQKNILSALKLSGSKGQNKSITMTQVIYLCKELIPEFKDDELKILSALSHRRNDELHSGIAAFQEYKYHLWAIGFYKCCKTLSAKQEETLVSLLGLEKATIASQMIEDMDKQNQKEVNKKIQSFAEVFQHKEERDKVKLKLEAEEASKRLSYQLHHKVICPACKCEATVKGDTYGNEVVTNESNWIVVRQSVIPRQFECFACGLTLKGYAELVAANVGEHFTHTKHFTPEDYYELIDPNDMEAMAYHAENHGFYHFSNE